MAHPIYNPAEKRKDEQWKENERKEKKGKVSNSGPQTKPRAGTASGANAAATAAAALRQKQRI